MLAKMTSQWSVCSLICHPPPNMHFLPYRSTSFSSTSFEKNYILSGTQSAFQLDKIKGRFLLDNHGAKSSFENGCSAPSPQLCCPALLTECVGLAAAQPPPDCPPIPAQRQSIHKLFPLSHRAAAAARGSPCNAAKLSFSLSPLSPAHSLDCLDLAFHKHWRGWTLDI